MGRKFSGNDYSGTIRAWDTRTGNLFDTFHRNGGAGAVILGLIDPQVQIGDDPDHSRDGRISTAWRLSQARPRSLSYQSYLQDHDGLQEGGPLWLSPTFPLEARGERITVHLDDRDIYYLIPITANGARAGGYLPGSAVSMNHSGDELLAFTPDDRRMAFPFRDRGILFWEIESRQLKILQGHRKPVRTLAFHPDGRALASGGHDGVICLWDLAVNGEPARFDWEIGMIDAVAFSPDGSTVAAGGRTGIVVWDVGEGLDS